MTRLFLYLAFASSLCAAAIAQPCEPVRVPDLQQLEPSSAASAFGTWDPDGPGPQASQLVLSGNFVKANKVTDHILSWDGAQFHTFGSGLLMGPTAMVSYYGKLVVAGQGIAPVGGTSLGTIGQWNGTTWQAFPGGAIQGAIKTLRVHDGWLYAGGSFNIPGTLNTVNIARSNGITWQALGQGLNGSVNSIEVFNDEIVAGGSFTASGAAPVRHVASWDGHSWQPFANGPGSTVEDFAVFKDQLVALRAGTLWIWDGAQWTMLPLEYPSWTSGAAAIHSFAGKLYVGGLFWNSSTDAFSGIVSWDGTSWSRMHGGLGMGGSAGSAACIADWNGDLFVGGNITHAGGSPANGVARWTGSEWRSIGSGWSKYPVGSIVATKNDVYALDDDRNLAHWQEQNWVSLPPLPVPANTKQIFSLQGSLFVVANESTVFRFLNNQWFQIGDPFGAGVKTLVSYDGSLVAAGRFVKVNGVTFNGVAIWNGTTWTPMADGLSNASLNQSDVKSLIVFKNDLYALGTFTRSGATELQGFTRWNGSEWIALDTGGTPNPSFPIVYRGELVTLGNGAFRAWNGESWRTAGDSFSGHVDAATVYNGRLVAGGYNIGAPENDLVQWTGSAWQRIQPSPNYGNSQSDGNVVSLESFEGQLFVGGAFFFMGDQSAINFARLSICSLCPADLNNDAIVDDADFCDFARDYDLMDCTDAAMTPGCPADLNHDGFVDDADFTSFVAEYAAFLCPAAS